MPFQQGQLLLPHPAVVPFCKIDCFYSASSHLADQFLPVSLNPKPINSKKKPISTQCLPVIYYNSDNILKNGRVGKTEIIYLGGV